MASASTAPATSTPPRPASSPCSTPTAGRSGSPSPYPTPRPTWPLGAPAAPRSTSPRCRKRASTRWMSAFLDRPTEACLAFGVTTPLTDGGARAWLCDLDGTLYHAGGVKWWMAAELLVLGPQHIPLLRAFRHAHEALRAEQV